MKISLAQPHIIWEDKKTNIEVASQLIHEQAQNGTELILFPEMSFTGFSMNTAITKESAYSTLNTIASLAHKNKIAVGFGWVKDCGETSENHYSVVDYTGTMLSDYVKIHPFSYSGENEYFRGGDKVSIFCVGNIKFSVFICYDLRFPEIFQAVSDTVSAIIVPANWPAKRREHWNTLLRARAIENQVYILAVNCVGNMDGQYYSGDSCIIDPDGNVRAVLSDKEGVINYEISDNIEMYRRSFPVRQDRKTEMYRNFSEHCLAVQYRKENK